MMLKDEGGKRNAILVEKMLDYKRYTKWNTNGGHVRESCSNTQLEIGDGVSIFVEDILQAYSHFTFLASGRRFLVCDLQGVFSRSSGRPVFQLTDPAIHYHEQTNRVDFGRTDHGEAGINKFFLTHKCSPLCRMMCRRWLDDSEDVVLCESITRPVVQSLTSHESDEVSDNSTKPSRRVRFAV